MNVVSKELSISNPDKEGEINDYIYDLKNKLVATYKPK
jgi:hypothetical protein